MKPIFTIDKFSNMHDKGVYYLEGLTSYDAGGQSLLSPTWQSNYLLSNSTTGFTNLGTINGFTPIGYNGDNTFNQHIIGISTDRLFDFDKLDINNLGELHQLYAGGTATDEIKASAYPDVQATIDNNILYSSAHHLGVGWLGICATGSGTTLIVDNAGRDFTTLGVSTSNGSNKVINLNTKEEFTITSITTTNSTNDTLNFTAGTNTNTAGDLFVVFVDNRFKFNVENSRGEQFANQDKPSEWKRQIKLIDNYYYILNGNYLARLGYDESTWTSDVLDETAKQLPKKHQAVCFDDNQGKILVGASYEGKGVLLLTNGWDDGWASKIIIEREPTAIRAYLNGWLVFVGDSIFYTNGYSITPMIDLPDAGSFTHSAIVHYNGVEIIQNNIIFSVQSDSLYNRKKNGIYIYNTDKGLTYVPLDQNGKYNYYSTMGALIQTYDRVYVGFSTSGNYYFGLITNSGSEESSTIFYQKLPDRMHLSKIEINLSPKFDNYGLQSGNVTVTVNVGEGNKPLWSYGTIGSGSTTTSIINTNGVYTSGNVGDEILIMNGNTAGERSYITAVSNQGTATETWTISPALSADPTGDKVNLIRVKKLDSKTINVLDIDDKLVFPIDGFYSDKVYIEVILKSESVNSLLDINSIRVY